MEDLRARTTLFCGVIAFAIALSMLLRGRRSVHWLFAAFATCVALWYTSQSLADLVKATIYVRGTGVLTVLWLGRRRIAGIAPGRVIQVTGRIGVHDGTRIMFNPRYELMP